MALKSTSFRLDDETLGMLDDLAEEIARQRDGDRVTRVQAVRAIVRTQHKMLRLAKVSKRKG